MYKIVVTGGAGMIGSSLVQRLLKDGNNILVIDNLSSGKIENLSEAQKYNNFKFEKADIKNLNSFIKFFQKADCVYHLAANPNIKFSMGDSTNKDLKENTIGTYNVLEAMRINHVKKIIFTSSSAVYGEPTVFPTSENYGPLKPISLYGASKLAGEALITSYSHLFGIQAWIFRLANVVGDKSRKKGKTVLADFIEKLHKNPKKLEILGNGKQKKSFLWVDDCIDGILTITEKSQERINLFNLGNIDSITIVEIAKIIISQMKLSNVKISYSGGERGWKGDSPFMLLDTSLAKSFGWQAKLSSKKAIEKSAEKLIAISNLS